MIGDMINMTITMLRSTAGYHGLGQDSNTIEIKQVEEIDMHRLVSLSDSTFCAFCCTHWGVPIKMRIGHTPSKKIQQSHYKSQMKYCVIWPMWGLGNFEIISGEKNPNF